MKKLILLVVGLIAVVGCSAQYSQDTSRTTSTPEPLEGTLLEDIEHATAVAWVGPHCDDEIVVSGLLALSSPHYKRDTYAVSFNEGASSFPPGATLEDRHKDNEEFKEFLKLKEYVWLGLDKYRGKDQKQKLFELLDEFIAETGVDLIVTFENTHGGNGHPDHIKGSKWLTEYCIQRGITLYYFINRDKTFGGKMDPLPYTDEIDLDSVYVTTAEGDLSLWELKAHVIGIYSSSVPSALNIVNSPEKQGKMLHTEFYRKVISSGSIEPVRHSRGNL